MAASLCLRPFLLGARHGVDAGEILAFNFSGSALQKAGVVKTKGGPAAIRTVEK
jgi:hypothetical protein